MYAHPNKKITRAYRTWLRAPMRGTRNQNLGAKWLRNSTAGESSWEQSNRSTPAADRARFMEVDRLVTEIPGENSIICFVEKNQSDVNHKKDIAAEIKGKNEMVVTDPKRRRVICVDNEELDNQSTVHGLHLIDGPKNGLEAGSVLQARLDQ